MGRGVACRAHGLVAREQLRVLAAEAERARRDEELGGPRLVDGGLGALEHGVEGGAAHAEVDLAAVVGIHEARLPQLAALVDVGHAGGRELDGLGGQRVRPARAGEPVVEPGDDRAGARVVEGRVDERVHALLERLVGRGPRGRVAGLARRLLGVRVQALARRGPRADERLPEQVLERAVAGRGDLAELSERVAPGLGRLGEHVDAGADVLAALRVVRRERGHGVRRDAVPLLLARVEVVDVDREDRRVGADLVERDEARVAVERRVLDALGHDHAARLLEALGDRRGRVGQLRHERVDGGDQVGAARARGLGGLLEVMQPAGQVAAVDGEGREELGERVGGVRRGVLDEALEAEDLAAEDPVRDAALRAADHVGPAGELALRQAAQRRLEVVELDLAVGVDEHAVDLGERVVPGGAGGRPVGGEGLAGLEDLLDEHVRAARDPREVVEVPLGVEQAVRVVDAEPVGEALAEPARDLPVRLLEDARQLDADARERVDREEAAVVELGVGAAPVDQLVGLALVHRAGVRVVLGRAGRDGEALVVVAELDGAVVAAHERELVELGLAVAEHGDPYLALPEVPVDVERVGVPARGAVREEVPPPEALHGRRDAHVVRDDVHQHAEAQLVRAVRDGLHARRAAAQRVHLRVVDHVVAVVGSRLGREDRAEVHPVRAEVLHVRQLLGHGGEVERLPHLEPVGGDGGSQLMSLLGSAAGRSACAWVRTARLAATEWSGSTSGSV
ncbi:hypothetical protein CMMCAS02_07640 [Clavibacter michiganensis subsp. michiganensis]|nr:hypothetical protein CMMCAS02_07640 [Clavibacter michiganensis subsp. michiganensis]OUE16038.1 hypothetical protein CMMCA002_07750 [Clavibacter michiganensis subsp. michiganensis]